MNERFRKIVEAGSAAPSGENAQPWHFSVHENVDSHIDVRIVPERDQSVYAWKDRSSYVAVGATVENIIHASTEEGLKSDVTLIPEPSDALLAARIRFTEASLSPSPLAKFILKRSTNRKPYERMPLSSEVSHALRNISEGDATVSLLETRDGIKQIAEAASVAEKIMLANPDIHAFFFGHINWTKGEDEKRRTGFFIDTLELPPPARVGFRLISSWRRALFLNKYLSFNNVVAAQNAKIYASASAVGIISTKSESPLSAIRAGMAFERLWLSVQKEGLWLQPLAGILFLALRVKAGDPGILSHKDVETIRSAYQKIQSAFNLNDRTAYMMFRIGKGKQPSASSVRFPIETITDSA